MKKATITFGKKGIRIIFVCMCIIVSFLSLAGCSDSLNVVQNGRNQLATEYPEWVDCLSIENEYVVRKWSEINISYDLKDDAEAVQKLSTTVARHNEFIRANPEYFSTEDRFDINMVMPAGYTGIRFLSDICKNVDEPLWWTFSDVKQLSEEVDGKIKFAYAELTDLYYIDQIADENITFDSEVVIIEIEEGGIDALSKNYDFMRLFPDAKKVVLNFAGDSADLSKLFPVRDAMNNEYEVYGAYYAGTIWPLDKL